MSNKDKIAEKFVTNLIDFIEFTNYLFDEYKKHFSRVPTQSEYQILITVIKSMDKNTIIKTFIPKNNKNLIYEKIMLKDVDFFLKNQQYMNILPEEVQKFIDINKILSIINDPEHINVFWDYFISFVKLSKKYEELE